MKLARYPAAQPWRSHKIRGVKLPVAMQSAGELAMLHWLASRYYRGDGEIIDAGCFLGGSTVPLAAGLHANPLVADKARRINTYDLFILEDYAKKDYFPDPGYEIGSSTLDVFERNVAPWRTAIEVFRGDILDFPWDGRPVELLFVDLSKESPINDFLVHNFFGRLIPGRSIVIQQDYVHEWLPWIQITMEYFKEYFEVLDYFYGGSAVFLLEKEIPVAAIEGFSWANFTHAMQAELMDRAIASTPVSHRALVALAKVRLLRDFESEASTQQATVLLDEIRRFVADTSNRIGARSYLLKDGIPAMQEYVESPADFVPGQRGS
jgi:hypothetical protein